MCTAGVSLNKKAVLSPGGPRDATVNFDTYRILQRHRAVTLPHHGFLVQAYISDRSNAENVPWFSRLWSKITAIAVNHRTRPKSRQKPRWSWICDYLTAIRKCNLQQLVTPTSKNFGTERPFIICWCTVKTMKLSLTQSVVYVGLAEKSPTISWLTGET